MSVVQKESNAIRTTLYLTQSNKQWLERQPRGKRTEIVNKAIAKVQEEKEAETKKQDLLKFMKNIKPVKSLIPSEEMMRMIRDGREDSLDAKLAILQNHNLQTKHEQK